MPETYLAQVGHFADFLLAYTHTLLYLRALYPPASFARARFHNTPVYQSRHPAVCGWVRDAVSAVHAELLAGTVARIGIAIYWHGGVERAGSPRVLERYMLDVSSFPVVDKAEQSREIEWDKSQSTTPNEQEPGQTKKGHKSRRPTIDADVDVDMSEQFRAALVLLTTRCSQLKPLPKGCSFNVCMELKDEPEIDPPVRHPQPWIPVQSSLQKTGRKGTQTSTEEGGDLGGVRTTPIRTVVAGILRFETWIEESKAKYELDGAAKDNIIDAGG